MIFSSLGRKRSQSPSPSRTTSPSRSLSPSANRVRDRSVSPLRYINLPVSKLARVTEELEHLIPRTSSIVHEEDEEEISPVVPEKEIVESNESSVPETLVETMPIEVSRADLFEH